MRARSLAVLVSCWLALSAVAVTGSAQTPGTAGDRPRYRLQATLDPSAGVLHGHVRIHWRNRSRAPVRELMLHLYANAFAHERTLFMREGGHFVRGRPLADPGTIELRTLDAIATDRRVDLLPGAQRELVPADRTQLRVPLPAPLAPGDSLELDSHFELRVPSIVARMGRAGAFFMIAQWYPKLAKHEPDGGWVSFPYHGLGEFYADFADHELELEVPREYVIAAPGTLLEARDGPAGTRIERYALNDALDVAWAAYPRFRRERMPAGAGVELEAFSPPGHMALARAQLALMREGLARLGARLGPYPYTRLVLVLPPADAYGASGMEYPGLIVGASASWHSELDAVSRIVHDATTTHELAHQWFPLLVASNELQAPVLDEGLAQWLGMDLLRSRYGRDGFWQRLVGLPADAFELLRAGFVRGPAPPSSLLPAWRYRPRELGPAVYARPALALESLRRTYGERRLWSALADYARSQRHQNPELTDLFAAFDRSYGPGFSDHLLAPLLSGSRTDLDRDGPAELTSGLGGADEARANLLDPTATDDQTRRSASAPQLPWLARLLYWAQLLLAMVGA